jgi:hypothetical protein
VRHFHAGIGVVGVELVVLLVRGGGQGTGEQGPIRTAAILATLLLAPCVAQADRITAAYPDLATNVANEDDSTAAAPAKREPRRSRFTEDVDYQKMAIITDDALGRGYKIMWVHPPQKARNKDRDDR